MPFGSPHDALPLSAPPKIGALTELLSLAAPTIAQMASYTVLQFTDTWMLAIFDRLYAGGSGVAPTAAGNSGMFSFSVISLGVGVLWVVNTLVSQSYGAGSKHICGRYLWQGIWFSLVMAALLLLVLPFSATIFRLSGHEPALVGMEASYFRIALGAAGLKLVGTAVGQFLLAINRPGLVLWAAVGGVVTNVLANWVMIFGHFGIEPMGVAGAAWGTNIAVLVEMSLLIGFAWRPGIRAEYGLGQWQYSPRDMKLLLKIGLPSGVQMVADVLAWSLFSIWVMAVFGTKAMAANTFMMRYMVMSFMPAFGMSVAVTALVGRYIGMGRLDIARKRANLAFVLTAIYMLMCGSMFFIFRHHLIRLFTQDPEILSIGATLLIFAAIYQFFDAMYIIYNGALRGAGDTLVPAVATGSLCWGITVFGGYWIARTWTHWGAAGPWTAATIYGVILGIFMLARFRRGDWKAASLDSIPGADTLPAFEAVAFMPPIGLSGEGTPPRP